MANMKRSPRRLWARLLKGTEPGLPTECEDSLNSIKFLIDRIEERVKENKELEVLLNMA